jgi:hypothetical protein
MFENQRKRSRYAKLISRFTLRNETPPDTEGATPPPTEKAQEDTTALKRALEQERLAVKAEKANIARLQAEMEALNKKFADVNPDEHKTLLQERESTKKLIAEREELQAKLNAEKESLTTKHGAEIADRDSKLTAMQERVAAMEKQSAIKEAFLNCGGNHAAAEDGTSHFQMFAALQGDRFKFDNKNNLIVVGSDGEPMKSIEDKTKNMTPAEYIKSLHTHPILGNCFIPAIVPSGTGGAHSSSAAPQNKVKSEAEMSNAERRAAYTANRQKV